jgi:hypothetical protein
MGLEGVVFFCFSVFCLVFVFVIICIIFFWVGLSLSFSSSSVIELMVTVVVDE